MEDLKWELDQKEREIQSLKQQLDLTEQHGKKELESTQQTFQVGAIPIPSPGSGWKGFSLNRITLLAPPPHLSDLKTLSLF